MFYPLFFIFLGLFQFSPAHSTEIQMRVLRGAEIASYGTEISSLCNSVYREYPYFYDASRAAWDSYVQSYADTPEAIACITLVSAKLIGVSLATPLSCARQKYNAAFSSRPEYLESLFYLGELALLPGYRRQGLGRKMYAEIEREVREKGKFSGICLWQRIEDAELKKVMPKGYTPVDPFWVQLGFERRADLQFNEIWKDVLSSEKMAHPMVCWIKWLTTNL